MPATDRAMSLAVAAAEAAADKLADDIVAFDVSDRLAITDVFVICSAPNDRQVRSIVDGVEERLRALDANLSAARANGKVVGCCSTSSTSSFTSSTATSGRSMRWTGCGRTAR